MLKETTMSDMIIDRITIMPDRFGLLRPMISFINDSNTYTRIITCNLPQHYDFINCPYAEGDIVDVVFRGSSLVEILYDGNTSAKNITLATSPSSDNSFLTYSRFLSNHHDVVSFLKGICCYCGKPTSKQDNLRYCINPVCSETNFARMIYAFSPGVLDVHFSLSDFERIQLDLAHTPTPITDILSLNNALDLQAVLVDEDYESILEKLTTRYQQFNGIQFAPPIQHIVQSRFLKALSIRGLYDAHITQLMEQLRLGRWDWSQLFEVLGNANVLVMLGIPSRDAKTIASCAQYRHDEIYGFSLLGHNVGS